MVFGWGDSRFWFEMEVIFADPRVSWMQVASAHLCFSLELQIILDVVTCIFKFETQVILINPHLAWNVDNFGPSVF